MAASVPHAPRQLARPRLDLRSSDSGRSEFYKDQTAESRDFYDWDLHGEPELEPDADPMVAWHAFLAHHAESPFERHYVVADLEARAVLDRHPWSLFPGGSDTVPFIRCPFTHRDPRL